MSPLEQLQLDCAARLNADPFFANIEVVVMRPRIEGSFVEIQTRVDQVIGCERKKNGKGGAAVQILMPLADGRDPDAPGPRLDFSIVARVQEHPILNMGPTGTKYSCEEIALRALQLLHHFNPGFGAILVAAKDALTPSDRFPGKITIDVRVTQQTGIGGVPKATRPVITAAGLSFTLSSLTVDAALYYTTDGSYPGAGNAAAMLYSGPVTLAAAATVRASAQADGLLPSDISQLTLS